MPGPRLAVVPEAAAAWLDELRCAAPGCWSLSVAVGGLAGGLGDWAPVRVAS